MTTDPVEVAKRCAKFYADLAEINQYLADWSLAPRKCEELDQLLNQFGELTTPLGDAIHQVMHENREAVSASRVRELALDDLQKYARLARAMSFRLVRIAEHHEAAFDTLDAWPLSAGAKKTNL